MPKILLRIIKRKDGGGLSFLFLFLLLFLAVQTRFYLLVAQRQNCSVVLSFPKYAYLPPPYPTILALPDHPNQTKMSDQITNFNTILEHIIQSQQVKKIQFEQHHKIFEFRISNPEREKKTQFSLHNLASYLLYTHKI
ncbi:hypothetical protein TorRG33x02_218670 [Trema orientale]|uniref:Uncharacterized protein n=1 Tax=Trema orientale TaxID=63057 RepID=A0A2P5E9Z2_TREOI|nr:hypothetical protein TorRG33x02_218670 [Trema orientale]